MFFMDKVIHLEEFDGLSLRVFQEYSESIDCEDNIVGEPIIELLFSHRLISEGFVDSALMLKQAFLIYRMQNGEGFPEQPEEYLLRHVERILASPEINDSEE